jgi:hypothetical protein
MTIRKSHWRTTTSKSGAKKSVKVQTSFVKRPKSGLARKKSK